VCNSNGYDISYGPEGYGIEPHFCRVYGDCGHVKNTVEDCVRHISNELQASLSYYENEILKIKSQILYWNDTSNETISFYNEQFTSEEE
jgi:hypothetical protein